jgi:hypothetical protein
LPKVPMLVPIRREALHEEDQRGPEPGCEPRADGAQVSLPFNRLCSGSVGHGRYFGATMGDRILGRQTNKCPPGGRDDLERSILARGPPGAG